MASRQGCIENVTAGDGCNVVPVEAKAGEAVTRSGIKLFAIRFPSSADNTSVEGILGVCDGSSEILNRRAVRRTTCLVRCQSEASYSSHITGFDRLLSRKGRKHKRASLESLFIWDEGFILFFDDRGDT